MVAPLFLSDFCYPSPAIMLLPPYKNPHKRIPCFCKEGSLCLQLQYRSRSLLFEICFTSRFRKMELQHSNYEKMIKNGRIVKINRCHFNRSLEMPPDLININGNIFYAVFVPLLHPFNSYLYVAWLCVFFSPFPSQLKRVIRLKHTHVFLHAELSDATIIFFVVPQIKSTNFTGILE